MKTLGDVLGAGGTRQDLLYYYAERGDVLGLEQVLHHPEVNLLEKKNGVSAIVMVSE